MIAPDTSVVLAALAPWHSGHVAARQMLSAAPARRLPVHVAFETCSTLSRMPEGERIASEVVYHALEMLFPDAWLCRPMSRSASTSSCSPYDADCCAS